MTQPVPPATIEPGSNVPQSHPRRRWRFVALILVAVILAGAIMAAGAVYTNAFGAGERFASLLHRIDLIVDPPPDRATAPTIDATPRPIARATASPEPSPSPTQIAVGPPGVAPRPSLKPIPDAHPHAQAQARHRAGRQEAELGVHQPADEGMVRSGRRPDGACLARPCRQHRAVPAEAGQPRARMGEPPRQPQRRLGTRRHGPGARGVRRAGVRDPRLQAASGGVARRGPRA